MFAKIRTSVLALAAIASLGAAALVSTTSSADAKGSFARAGISGGISGIAVNRGVITRGGLGHVSRVRPIFRLPHVERHRPHFHRHRHVHIRWHKPWIYGVGVAAVAAPAYAAAPRPCTCLTKEYTPDNVVVFKDLCTKEMAAAPIGGQQSQLVPQAGELEPVPTK